MEYEDIKRLLDDMGNSKVDSLDIEFPDGTKIKMKKNETKVVEKAEPKPGMLVIKENVLPTEQKEETKAVVKTENYKEIKSPMVGTFYSSPSPKDLPYVKVGDKVKKGDVLCVVEAMKLMNEIESEYDGEIVEICVKNEDMVEYGTTLFKIK
ncbi:MAG: acetyl-CoA carboxylase biotin carboxyl carrier protein [Clostridia bacterium]|jgi:acetyl-coA carboxylase, biotin carboxyl carrier protein